MSGYLKRLAAGARKPGGAIHPVLGSLYSAPATGNAFEDLPEAEEIVSWVAPTPAVTPVLREAEERLLIKTALPEIPRPAPMSRPLPATRPLMEPLEKLFEPREEFRAGSTAPAAPPLPNTPREAPRQPLALPGEATARVEAARRAEPLIPAHQPERLLPYFEPPPGADNSRAANAVAVLRESPPRPLALQGRMPLAFALPRGDSDTIEIHIGRVEVTAAPQAATRQAAPPARKPINLDEYLKRGDRRAR
jgi:hypothetical protein